MNFMVREAMQSDYPAIDILFVEGDSFHAVGLPKIFSAPVQPTRHTFIEQLLADPNAAIFVAEESGAIVGTLMVVIHQTPPLTTWVPRCVAEVDGLIVHHQYRGAGIGRALMAHVEQWAKQHGATSLEFNVWDFEGSAIPFYEKLGYAPLSHRMSKDL